MKGRTVAVNTAEKSWLLMNLRRSACHQFDFRSFQNLLIHLRYKRGEGKSGKSPLYTFLGNPFYI